jgi:hypothetical protein
VGLVLSARCTRCELQLEGLRLGATMEQMSGERRSFLHLFRCRSCREITGVELALGEISAARCPKDHPFEKGDEYRIVRMKGLVLEGHACPRCGEATLAFKEEGQFL